MNITTRLSLILGLLHFETDSEISKRRAVFCCHTCCFHCSFPKYSQLVAEEKESISLQSSAVICLCFLYIDVIDFLNQDFAGSIYQHITFTIVHNSKSGFLSYLCFTRNKQLAGDTTQLLPVRTFLGVNWKVQVSRYTPVRDCGLFQPNKPQSLVNLKPWFVVSFLTMTC